VRVRLTYRSSLDQEHECREGNAAAAFLEPSHTILSPAIRMRQRDCGPLALTSGRTDWALSI
jgi:hypothetical protein